MILIINAIYLKYIYLFTNEKYKQVTGEYPYSECKNAAQVYKKVTQGIKPECLEKVTEPQVLDIINNCLLPENERYLFIIFYK